MAKKSRRARKEARKRREQQIDSQPTPEPTVQEEALDTESDAIVMYEVQRGPATTTKVVNFAKDYFYVYQDMRNTLIIAILMFALLVGLSFVI